MANQPKVARVWSGESMGSFVVVMELEDGNPHVLGSDITKEEADTIGQRKAREFGVPYKNFGVL